ncbi:hypothetical protein [Shewanella sp.]|uniref:hypothetical protein n=1 Tax=Shewanella sp. TaxID=50422 RepID=UPI003A973B9F
MFLLLVLPILVSGYIIFTKSPYHFYRLHRYDGQLLYLESAKLGLCCTIWSVFITLPINNYMPATITFLDKEFNIDLVSLLEGMLSSTKALSREEQRELAWILIISLNSLFIARLYVFLQKTRLHIISADIPEYISRKWNLIKIFFKTKNDGEAPSTTDDSSLSLEENSPLSLGERMRIILMSSILTDSPIDDLFFKSYLIDGYYIMLTMEDRKVYIGRVISLGEPNESEGMDQEITITPYASGFRDKDNLGITLTTKYMEVSTDLAITLRQDKILSATHFSDKVYEEFQDRKNKAGIIIK